ncbi:MAG TPA: type II toxin-antitoxin system RelE/ParE family toxin [Thermoanaerobaculia bacterium]|nr:type II toxin-antitoxin system RelE/ParE family toxin [Thermoanaerobaculia bacterium]
MKSYRFLAEAENEFQEQIRYFDEQVAGLGNKFIADLEFTVESIRAFPESGAPVSQNLRKRLLRVFRHSVFYVKTQDEIIVVAVAPYRRRPGYWRKRMQNLTR